MAAYPPPAPGDLVWCRFPQREHLHPAKPRSALVLSVMDPPGSDPALPPRVRVAYGTSQRTDRVAPTEVLISPDIPEAWALSGLSRPTKLCMTNVVVLDYTELWFERAPGSPPRPSPRLGVLHPVLMDAVRRALQAAGLL